MGLNDDGGCEVDWSWLAGQRVAAVRNSLDAIVITFESGLEWKVEARLWKGAPFLAFDPWKAPVTPP
jgi:hypothetical protein